MTSNMQNPDRRQLTMEQAALLERHGCTCPDWNRVRISPDTDLRLIRFCRFYGDVSIGSLLRGAEASEGLYNAVIADCNIGDNVYINNVGGRLYGLNIGSRVRIDNVGRIEAEPGASFGIGTEVSALDETGSRHVAIFPGITSQIATLAAHRPRWAEQTLAGIIEPLLDKIPVLTIGDGAVICDTRRIHNVCIGNGVVINGASNLKDGSIINNSHSSRGFAYIGQDVDAEHFIIEDACVDSGVLLRNCYVGQGVQLEKRFTAHDSLFFANSSCECGEACAILAGPYTVTMHKSSLLIGGQYSFFNAGSGTNSSNHKYKLGPVHWGMMHRGVKTSSDAYIMWGGSIGAFSLLMGSHKQHPDTSLFPFSYLFGTPDGATVAAPALMLKSCGLMRDQMKWPKRDRRVKARLPLHDNIHFEVLNPVTVEAVIKAIPVLDEISSAECGTDGFCRYNGILIKPKSAKRAIELYSCALAKYILAKQEERKTVLPEITVTSQPATQYEWCDLGGQILPYDVVSKVTEASTLSEIQNLLDKAFAEYSAMELDWIDAVFSPELMARLGNLEEASRRLDELVEQDRKDYLSALSDHASKFSL